MPIVKGHETLLIQLFQNIISNAIKFCEPETGTIDIDYRLGNKVLEVSVVDNGKGIPSEDIAYIFDKFYQSQYQNTVKPEGSGLGLAITKQIIEKHQGEIWVDNSVKTGAKFVFTLPIR